MLVAVFQGITAETCNTWLYGNLTTVPKMRSCRSRSIPVATARSDLRRTSVLGTLEMNAEACQKNVRRSGLENHPAVNDQQKGMRHFDSISLEGLICPSSRQCDEHFQTVGNSTQPHVATTILRPRSCSCRPSRLKTNRKYSMCNCSTNASSIFSSQN